VAAAAFAGMTKTYRAAFGRFSLQYVLIR
jgi:hypothetical protein